MCYATVLTKLVAYPFSQAAVTQRQTHFVCNTLLGTSKAVLDGNSACIFDGQTSTEKLPFVLVR